MGDVPEQGEPGRRCQLQAAGHRINDSSWRVRLVIEEADDGCWVIHGLGAPGVRLPATVMITLATSILHCAHR